MLGVGPYNGHRQEILAGWRKDITELAKCPNVIASSAASA